MYSLNGAPFLPWEKNFVLRDSDRGGGVVDIFSLVEKSEQLEIFALGDGIEFVAVTLGTAQSQSQPNGTGCVDSIDDFLVAKLFVIGAAFLVDQCVAVKKPRR